ncbi:hypothetical protein Tco_0979253 [Tanacetum coccineum]
MKLAYTKDYHQLRSQIKEVVKSGQLSHLVKGIKKERANSFENQRLEGKKDKGAMICTDIAKITRKRSKPDKHGHGNGIECAKAGRMLSKSYTSPIAPIGGNPKGNDTRAKEKAHLSRGICTKMCEKEAQWL